MLDQIRPIDYIGKEFEYIYNAAKASKCSTFFIDASTNRLYGAPQEPYKIHVINLPFRVTGNIIFEIATESTPIDLIKEYDFNFFQAGIEMRYMFIHKSHYDDYTRGYLRTYGKEVFNLRTGEYCEDCFSSLSDEDEIFRLNKFTSQVTSIKNILDNHVIYNIPNTEYFDHIEQRQDVRRILDGKVSDGSFMITFGEDNKRSVSLFKGFITAARNDLINLTIYYDKPQSCLFRFTIIHKKNVFKDLKIKSIPEDIYCRFLNV